ncbi:hypothetical protein QQ39_14835 [Pragia fontium]|nr:hypothetical protein QQ39_14835 [Pragia fontium]
MYGVEEIFFKPNIHSDKIVIAIQPPVHGVESLFQVIYPDGTIEKAKSPYFIDCNKLHLIK